MSEPYDWFAKREIRRRQVQALARGGFYLLTAASAAVVIMALDPFKG